MQLGEIEGLVDSPTSSCEQVWTRNLVTNGLPSPLLFVGGQELEVVERLLGILARCDRLDVQVLQSTSTQRAVVAHESAGEVPGPGCLRENAVGVGIQPRHGSPELLRLSRGKHFRQPSDKCLARDLIAVHSQDPVTATLGKEPRKVAFCHAELDPEYAIRERDVLG